MMDVQMRCVHGVLMERECGKCRVDFGNARMTSNADSVMVRLDQEFLKAAQTLTASADALRNAVDALNATVKDMRPAEVLPEVEFVEVKRGPITQEEVIHFHKIWGLGSLSEVGHAILMEALTGFAKSRGLL